MSNLEHLIRSLPPTLPLYPNQPSNRNNQQSNSFGQSAPHHSSSSAIGSLNAADEWFSGGGGQSFHSQLNQFNNQQQQQARQFKQVEHIVSTPNPNASSSYYNANNNSNYLPSSSPNPMSSSAMGMNEGMSDDDFSRFLNDTESAYKNVAFSPLPDPSPLPPLYSSLTANSTLQQYQNNKLQSSPDAFLNNSTAYDSWAQPNQNGANNDLSHKMKSVYTSSTGDLYGNNVPSAKKRTVDQADLDNINIKSILSSLTAQQQTPQMSNHGYNNNNAQTTHVPNGAAPSGYSINLSALGKKDAPASSVMQAQYPVLSAVDSNDGFYSANVNVTSSIFNGADDSELGFNTAPVPAPVVQSAPQQTSATQNVHLQLQQLQAQLLNQQRQREADAVAAAAAAAIASAQQQPNPLLSLPASLGSNLASLLQSPAQLSSSTTPSHNNSTVVHSIFDPDSLFEADQYEDAGGEPDGLSTGGSVKGEGVRRAKRRLTDKQRRAKIKEGLESLRSLVAMHGNSSTDQASIVSSSVDLVQQLVGEAKGMRAELEEAQKESLQTQMQMQQAVEQFNQEQKQKQLQFEQQQQQQKQQAMQQQQQNNNGLGNALSSILGNVKEESNSNNKNGSAISALLAADPSLAESLDQIILSSYFLQTLQLLSKLPKNQNNNNNNKLSN